MKLERGGQTRVTSLKCQTQEVGLVLQATRPQHSEQWSGLLRAVLLEDKTSDSGEKEGV